MTGAFHLAAAAVALLLGATGCATLAPAPVSDTAAIPLWKDFSDKPRGYLPAQAIGAEAYLAPPPARGSARETGDLAVYSATRALEGSDRWRQAQSDANAESPTAPKAFDCALGTSLDVAKQPILVRMLLRASTDGDNLSRSAKLKYARPRPFLIKDGPICISREQWLIEQGAYPSGHAATGWTWGLILSELAPDRSEALMSRARSFGDSRVICGVHYVSDIEAGRLVASATVARLHADPVFKADLETARAELAAARASTPAPATCPARDALDAPAF
jgi:acid phosphatase (class A)